MNAKSSVSTVGAREYVQDSWSLSTVYHQGATGSKSQRKGRAQPRPLPHDCASDERGLARRSETKIMIIIMIYEKACLGKLPCRQEYNGY